MTTHKVYLLVNRRKKQVYYGVSKDPETRLTKYHCVKQTKELQHWNCDRDKIWGPKVLSRHRSQARASARAHQLERTRERYWRRKGYKVIKTRGI